MTGAVIVAEHLTKQFGARRGITDVTFTVDAGGVFGFLGPNGAGKTTTIRCLLGLYRPTRGRVRVLGHNGPAGHDSARGDATFLRDVGYLPGELNLPGALTGAEVLDRFGAMRGLLDTGFRDELIDRFGAELDRPIRSLSKGNKQKLGIVLAFMHRPRLLVLDEPTSGLDPLRRDEFATLLRETSERGQTVLLSSHDLGEVQRVAQRLAIIRSGRIVVDDTVEALRAAAPRTIELTFDHDVNAACLQLLPEVRVDSASARRVVLAHTGAVAPLLRVIADLEPETITARPADLDELFLRLYTESEDAHAH